MISFALRMTAHSTPRGPPSSWATTGRVGGRPSRGPSGFVVLNLLRCSALASRFDCASSKVLDGPKTDGLARG